MRIPMCTRQSRLRIGTQSRSGLLSRTASGTPALTRSRSRSRLGTQSRTVSGARMIMRSRSTSGLWTPSQIALGAGLHFFPHSISKGLR